MKKKYPALIAVLALVVFGAVALYYVRKSASATYIVASADGSATLSIPKSALPKGKTDKDIRITKLSSEETVIKTSKTGQNQKNVKQPVAVYRMEPNGLVFDEPVSFSVQLDSASLGGSVPVMLSIDDKKLEFIGGNFSMDESGAAVLTGNIEHFTDVVVDKGFFDVGYSTDLGDHYIGEPFSFPITITKHDNFSFLTKDILTKEEEVANFTLTADPIFDSGAFNATSYILTPGWVRGAPPHGTIMTDDTMYAAGTFTCTRRGNAKIEYNVIVRYVPDIDDSTESFLSYLLFTSNIDGARYLIAKTKVNCMERPTTVEPVTPKVSTPTPVLTPPKTAPVTPKSGTKDPTTSVKPKDSNPTAPANNDTIGFETPEKDSPTAEVKPTTQKDICCYNAKAKVGERYYIPFDGSGCMAGDQQVPLDKDCGNPLFY